MTDISYRAQAHDIPPPSLPGYRFIEHVGVGGNAQVYLYERERPHRRVAVKVLSEPVLSETARGGFMAQANDRAYLVHRHIVPVLDAGVMTDGRPYLVMPYYPLSNLSVRMRRARFSVAEVLRIGIQIGGAVETSHRRGMLHRNIKPRNILTDGNGEVALTDFAIAGTKGDERLEGLSAPWLPPEILYGTAPADQRSDVYSLGATLWHLLAGRPPFEEPGGDSSTYALMRRSKSAPAPRTQRADVPESLERLLGQAMAMDLAARPPTALELIRVLQSIEQELRLPLTQPILPAAVPPAAVPPLAAPPAVVPPAVVPPAAVPPAAAPPAAAPPAPVPPAAARPLAAPRAVPPPQAARHAAPPVSAPMPPMPPGPPMPPAAAPNGDPRGRPPMPGGETAFGRGRGPLAPRPQAVPAGLARGQGGGHADPRMQAGAASRGAGPHPNSGQPSAGANPYAGQVPLGANPYSGPVPWAADPRIHPGPPPPGADPRTYAAQPPPVRDPRAYAGPPPPGADPRAYAGPPPLDAAPRTNAGQAPPPGADSRTYSSQPLQGGDPRTAPGVSQRAVGPWDSAASAAVGTQERATPDPDHDHDPDHDPDPDHLDPWAAAAADAGPRSGPFPPEAPGAAAPVRTAGRHSAGRHSAGRHGAARSGSNPFKATSPSTGVTLGTGALKHSPPTSSLAITGAIGPLEMEKKARSRRLFAFAGGGLVLAVIVGVVVLVLRGNPVTPSAATNTGQTTQTGVQGALGAASRGSPTVKASRLSNGSTQVLFSWTYDPHESGDTFPWKGVGGVATGMSGTVDKPQLSLTVATGQTACIEVWVKRAKGGQLSVPTTTCSP